MAKAKDKATANDEPQESGGSKMKIILIALGAVLLIGASVGGTLLFVGGAQPPAETAEAEPVKEKGTPRYLKLDPAFTVNLEGSASLLRISIAVLVYGDEVESVLTEHMPQIRNSLVLLFSSQDADIVRERNGKEQLRQSTLDTLHDIAGKYIDIEDMEVFFTGFVLQ